MKWSSTLKRWIIENSASNYTRVVQEFNSAYAVDLSALHSSYRARKTQRIREKLHKEHLQDALNEEALAGIEKLTTFMRARNYSPHTVTNYTAALRVYFGFYGDVSPESLHPSDYLRFCEEYLIPGHYSKDYQRMLACALRLLYGKVFRSKWDVEDVVYPRKERVLPIVLSRDEVAAIIRSTPNLKAECLLALMYSCGLRVGEVLRLRWKDIDRDRGLIWIRRSKGFKDRSIPISKKMLAMLEKYFHKYRPPEYIFEGQNGGQYSSSSVNQTIRSVCLRLRINKKVTAHTFRHSFATHLMESGTNLRIIQTLLGHKSSKTTEIYTHVSEFRPDSFRNPFDEMED